MRITIEITRSSAGMFYARSKEAPTFFAAHNDETFLRKNIARAVNLWAASQGRRVQFALAAPRVRRSTKAEPKAVPV